MGASEDNVRPLGYYRQASHGDPALHRRRDTAYMPPLCLWLDSSITLSVIPEAPCSRASFEGPINSQNAPFCTLRNRTVFSYTFGRGQSWILTLCADHSKITWFATARRGCDKVPT